MEVRHAIPDLATLDDLAQVWVRMVGVKPAVVHLVGPLGVGKTTFVRLWLRHLGLTDAVRSPSFTLLECYEAEGLRIVHTDLFRLRGGRELENLGLRDFVGEALILIEWPERGEWATPPFDIRFVFEYDGAGRRVMIETRAGFRVGQGPEGVSMPP